MGAFILVTGATGKLGQLVVRRLLDRGEKIRVLTRRPEEALRLWGDRVEIVFGDFALPESLPVAFKGAGKVFLLSPISEHLAGYQTAAIDAAVAAEVSRVVKISGSDWTIENTDRSVSGAAHAAVENYLANQAIDSVVIRPNAWMQVSLAPVVAAALKGEDLPARYGNAAVSFIDAEDIADVAVNALLAAELPAGPLVLTGEDPLTALEIARVSARILKRPVALSDKTPGGFPPDLGAFERRAISEFIELIGEGHAATVTDTVERITGHPPRSVERFLARHLGVASVRTGSLRGEKTWH